MKHINILLISSFCFFQPLTSYASTPAEVQAQIDATITSNGTGGITGAILNAGLTDIIGLFSNYISADSPTFTGTVTLPGNINIQSQTGFLYANNGSLATFYTLGPTLSFSGSTIGLNLGSANIWSSLQTLLTNPVFTSCNGYIKGNIASPISCALSINGVPVGNTSASTGAFTTLSATAGIDNTIIGAGTPANGTFTNLNANTKLTVGSGAIQLTGDTGYLFANNASNASFSSSIPSSAIQGTVAGGNATAGFIGEYISSAILAGASVSLTTGVTSNVTSIVLTPGDWDCSGSVILNKAGGTTTTSFAGGISQTSATLPTAPAGGGYFEDGASAAGISPGFTFGVVRQNVTVNTNLFLVTISNFAVSTTGAYGFLGCRRVR